MREQVPNFVEGDSVVVRDGVEHPELGTDLSGWQGWITEMILDETYGELAVVSWDSQTLEQSPQQYRDAAEEAGIDFTQTTLVPVALLRASPRDEPGDAIDVAAALDEDFDWDYLGKQGERIREVITGAATRRDAFQRWVGHLAQNLDLPFTAEVANFRAQGPLQEGDVVEVRRISLVDDRHGVIVGVRFRHQQYDIPLIDLEAVDEMSANYRHIDDYIAWWEESRDQ
jgi:hypothetical protein